MSDDDRGSESSSDILSGFANLLASHQEKSDERHSKSDSKIDVLIESVNKLTLSNVENKKDREADRLVTRKLEKTQIDQGKQMKVMNETLILVVERQSNTKDDKDKGTDIFHKVLTGLLIAAFIYLAGFK